jgi:hypothetical protein
MKHVQADKYLNFKTWLSRKEVRRMEKACFRYFELKEKKNTSTIVIMALLIDFTYNDNTSNT